MQTVLGRRRWLALAASTLAVPLAAQTAQKQKRYDTGASDSEIKIGNFAPYSGPASAFGNIGKTYIAFFNKINSEGGINGRKINFISLDDAYNPAQSVEQTRRLVERDRVLFLFGTTGTSHNQAIQRYMNQREVPQLFVTTGAARWGDPKNFPWTMGWQPTYEREAQIIAEHILKTRPNARIAVLQQSDDFGKDSFKGMLDGLGAHAKDMVVSHQTYELSDPTIDSQMVGFKNSGADVFINLSSPKFAAQSIRKMMEIGWQAEHYLSSVSASISAVFQPAGLENARGIISSTYMIDPTDPQFRDSEAVRDYLDFMKKWYPQGDPVDGYITSSYAQSLTLLHLLKQCGDNLTRAHIMAQAARLDTDIPMLRPGIRVKTAPDDFYPIKDRHLVRFDGTRFVPVE